MSIKTILSALCWLILTPQVYGQSGNVGIGITAPQAKLHTVGSVRHDTLAGQASRLVFADSSGRLFTASARVPSSIAPASIPDDGCLSGNGATSTITVTGMPAAVSTSGIKVRVDISYPFDEDLYVFLVAPNGATLCLIGANGYDGDNFTNTILWDGAAQNLPTVSSAGAPFSGTYKPTGGTSPCNSITTTTNTFGGLSSNGAIVPNGVWTLRVFDAWATDLGTLNNWSISFDGTDPELPAPPFTYNVIPKGGPGGLVNSSVYDVNGSVGIGTATPTAPLQFANAVANRKVVLFGSNNDHQFYGFGVNGGVLRYQTDHAGADHVFYSAASATASTELMRIRGGGAVGIGTATPAARLHVAADANTLAGYFTSAANTFHGHGIFRIQYVGTTLDDQAAVYGYSVPSASHNYGIGVIGEGGFVGVNGRVVSNAQAPVFGVRGLAYSNDVTYGIYGFASDNGNIGGTKYGVYGNASGGAANWAGYFNGNVNVTGNLSKGGGTFKIDHPQDPTNKYLYHSFIESPDMMNIYNGNIITDAAGYAMVELPSYFDALNKDFRYCLTVVDGSDDFVMAKVVEKISGNHFRIRTSKPGVEVSWQVTGVRKDAWANQNRVVPVVDKAGEEKGTYLHPTAFGKPESAGTEYRRRAKEEDAHKRGASSAKE